MVDEEVAKRGKQTDVYLPRPSSGCVSLGGDGRLGVCVCVQVLVLAGWLACLVLGRWAELKLADDCVSRGRIRY